MIKSISEIVHELLYSCDRLYEFSSPLGAIRKHVKSLSPKVIQHILKIIYYGDSCPESLSHWITEINTFLHDAVSSTIKGSNRYPSQQQLYSWLAISMENIDDFVGQYRVVQAKGYDYTGAIADIHTEDAYAWTQEFLHEVVTALVAKSLSRTRLEQYVSKILLRRD